MKKIYHYSPWGKHSNFTFSVFIFKLNGLQKYNGCDDVINMVTLSGK